MSRKQYKAYKPGARVLICEGVDKGTTAHIIEWAGPRDQYDEEDVSPHSHIWIKYPNGTVGTMAKAYITLL